MTSILVVDDEQSIRESFKLILSDRYSVITAASGEAAVKYASDSKIELAFLDIRMPGMDGLETLKKIKEIAPELIVIMVTAVNDVQKASEAIRLGAQDYVVKPFDVEQILKLASNLLFKKTMLDESRKAGLQAEMPQLIGSSEKIETVRRLAKKAADGKGGVLILGPGGVEKEAVAQKIANCIVYDARRSRLKLFGDSGGATVADLKKTAGAIDLAEDGAIFIDHAEMLPAWAQEKLLKYEKVRILLGTSANLKESGFNQKLYEEAADTIIELPPLFERATDIPQLIEYYLAAANRRYMRNIKGFTPEAMNLASSYRWPGNVIELASVVFNLVLLADKPLIEAEDLPFDIIINESSFSPIPLEDLYSQLEKTHIKEAMKAAGQDKERAAKLLGITTTVLEAKL
ncbi:MAG: response regulator [Candidatus Margulisiibacteriota bacterium]